MKPALSLRVAETPPSITPTSPRATAAQPATPSRANQRSRQSLLRKLTRTQVAAPILGAALLLIAWTAFVRLPALRKLMTRPPGANPASPRSNTAQPIDPAREAEVAAAVETRRARLVKSRSDYTAALNQIETEAGRLGFRIELTPRPAIQAYAGFKELKALPVAAQLERLPEATGAAYAALLQWIHSVESLPASAEVTRLVMDSNPAGAVTWQVDLQFLADATHEESAAE